MTGLGAAAGAAAAVTAGGLLAWRAVAPRRVPLAVRVHDLLADSSTGAPRVRRPGAGAGLVAAVDPTGRRWPRLRADLCVADFAVESHAVRTLAAGLVFAMLAALLAFTLAVIRVHLPTALVAVAVVCAAVGGAVVPTALVRSTATERRRELRQTLPGYLDLAGVVLAAGESLESALRYAARLGDGWAYRQLQQALTAASAARQPAAGELTALANRMALPELAELADTMALSATEGTSVRASLAARAHALRDRELTSAETNAGRVTETMAFPLMFLVAGFVLLIGYPAMVGLAGGLGAS